MARYTPSQDAYFQRRHHESIAQTLAQLNPVQPKGSAPQNAWEAYCMAFVEQLSKDNARFDKGRFLDACGLPNVINKMKGTGT